MSQRNPFNQRYRDEDRKGKTRKSASSAKPVSRAGASVHVNETDPKARRKQEREKQRERERQMNSVPVKYTEREKFWRKIWWVTLIAALVCLTASWFAGSISGTYVTQITYAGMIGAYALLGIMIFIDIKFVRPARIRARTKGASLSKKERRAMAERQAAEEQYRREHPSIIDKTRKWLNSTGKKKTEESAKIKDAAGKNDSAK